MDVCLRTGKHAAEGETEPQDFLLVLSLRVLSLFFVGFCKVGRGISHINPPPSNPPKKYRYSSGRVLLT